MVDIKNKQTKKNFKRGEMRGSGRNQAGAYIGIWVQFGRIKRTKKKKNLGLSWCKK